jgi:hypothetical protein
MIDLTTGSAISYLARSSVSIDDRFGADNAVLRRSGFAMYAVTAGRFYRFDVNHTNANIGSNNQEFGNVQARVRSLSGDSFSTAGIHTVGSNSDIGIPFTSPWSQYSVSSVDVGRNVSFWVQNGICYLSGIAKGGNSPSTIFVLPSWARPAGVRLFIVDAANTWAELAVWNDGNVRTKRITAMQSDFGS